MILHWPRFESRSANFGADLLYAPHAFLHDHLRCTNLGSGIRTGHENIRHQAYYRWSDAAKLPADNASKILTIEFLFCLLLDLFCLLFGNPQCANAGFGFGLVLVWFVVSMPAVSAAVQIPCSQVGIAILAPQFSG